MDRKEWANFQGGNTDPGEIFELVRFKAWSWLKAKIRTSIMQFLNDMVNHFLVLLYYKFMGCLWV